MSLKCHSMVFKDIVKQRQLTPRDIITKMLTASNKLSQTYNNIYTVLKD